MRRRFLLFATLVLGLGLVFSSCGGEEAEDTCSNELGNIQDDYNCEKPVTPQICTVDGVDDHWVLDGVEYDCPNNDCTVPPAAMIEAMQEKFGCATKKSLDIAKVNQEISERAGEILANLRAESALCSN